MSESAETPEDLVNIELSLRSLVPRGASLDRDALMFAAGRQAATTRSRGFVPALAFASAVVGIAIGFASGRMTDRGAQVAQQPLTQPQTNSSQAVTEIIAPDDAPVAPSENSYIVLRRRMLSGDFNLLIADPREANLPDAPSPDLPRRHSRDFDQWIDPQPKHPQPSEHSTGTPI